MKFLLATALSPSLIFSVGAFSPPSFAVRKSALGLADYDLDFGKVNGYETAPGGDGGQGQFGAQSPNDWRMPGTSPIGQNSYPGADPGGEEPWFSEAVSTVSLDLKKAEDTLMAFTKKAAMFKMEQFAATKPFEFTTTEVAYGELVGKLGYNVFLESSDKTLAKEWKKLHPPPKKEELKVEKGDAKDPPKKKAAPTKDAKDSPKKKEAPKKDAKDPLKKKEAPKKVALKKKEAPKKVAPKKAAPKKAAPKKAAPKKE